MSILMFLLFGLIVGFLARAIMPGRQSMGFIATALLGVAGSFVGGFIANLLFGVHGQSILELRSSGFIGSILGALVVLAIMGWSGRRHSALSV